MSRFNIDYYLKKGYFVIPVAIFAIIVLGVCVDISEYNWSIFKFAKWSFLPCDSTIWVCEILPLIVFLYSLLSIIRQGGKIKRYRKELSNSSHFFGFKYIKFLLKLPKRYFIPQLAYFMLLFWSIGWGLYMMAVWSNYESNSTLAEIIGYSAISSLDLFLMDINGNVLDSVGGSISGFCSSLLKGGIVIVAIMCAMCTFSLLIRLFLHSLVSSIHTSSIKINDSNNHLYIFFGINEKSIHLANSIKSSSPNNSEWDEKALIAFIESVELNDEETDGIQNILSIVSPSTSKRASIELDEHTLHLYSTSSISDCENKEDIWMALGTDEISRILQELEKTNGGSIHVFFLSENRDENVLHSRILAEHFSKNEPLKRIPKTIYCATRKDGVTSLIEDSRSNPEINLETKIIDDAHLSIEILKKDSGQHPINFVSIDQEENVGAVSSPLTSLIVGFGETGRDALRFIYEFGALLDSTSKSPQRSPFFAYVVDHNMENLKGHFLLNHPGINSESNVKQNNNQALVTFCDYNDKSQEFYQLLKNIGPSLNYVVVALGDDETNMTAAVNILKIIRRYRSDLKNFRIFVRLYEDSVFSHLESIANRYNKTLEKESNCQPIFKIFGATKDLYTYKMIVKDTFLDEAIDYYNTYIKEYNKTVVGLYYKETGWYDRRSRALESGEQSKIDDLRRKEFQDRENALHKQTKELILESVLLYNYRQNTKIEKKEIINEFINSFFSVKEGEDSYRKDITGIEMETVHHPYVEDLYTFAYTLIKNLAITEHLRWNASHEMLGYEFGEGKSTIKMTHNCLVTWDKLPLIKIFKGGTDKENAENSNLVRLYDYLVVETTLNQIISRSIPKR